MSIKNLLLSLGTTLLVSCGGGGGSDAVSTGRILGLTLDDPASPSKLYVTNIDSQTIQTLNLSSQASYHAGGWSGYLRDD